MAFRKRTGAEVRYVRNFWFLRIFLWQSGLLSALFKYRGSPVVFLGVMYHLSTWPGALLVRALGGRVLFWTHGFLRLEYGLKGWIRKRFYRLSEECLVYGLRAQALFKTMRLGIPAKVIFNSLDWSDQKDYPLTTSAERKRIREKMRIAEEYTLVFSGRLIRKFRLDLLFRALAFMQAKGESLPAVLVVGDGPEAEGLHRQIQEHGLKSSIQFFGAVYDQHLLAKIFSVADICVVPAKAGLSVIHAMSFGVPVITDNAVEEQMPESEAIIEGVTGFFYHSGDVQSLAAAIIKARESNEPMRVSCRHMVEQYYNPENQAQLIFASCFPGDA